MSEHTQRIRLWISESLYGWMDNGDAVGNGTASYKLLAEDEYGDLFVPSRSRADWWDRRLNMRNPTHWRYYIRSRRQHNIVMIESVR